MCFRINWCFFLSHEECSNLIVENEDESTTGTSKDVGKASLEESGWTFVCEDLLEAVHSTIVHLVFSSLTGSHHESSSHGIEWVRGNTCTNGNNLCESPESEDVSFLVISPKHDLTGIEHTEVGGSVGDDTNDGDTETSVKTLNTVLSSALLEAVNETIELSLSTGTDISSKSGSCEIKRVDETKGSSTCSTTGGHVGHEELSWVLLWVLWWEKSFEEIFACEVQSLSWEITDDVGHVTSVKSPETLLLDNSGEAVSNTVVSLLSWQILDDFLHLKQEFDSLNWGDNCL